MGDQKNKPQPSTQVNDGFIPDSNDGFVPDDKATPNSFVSMVGGENAPAQPVPAFGRLVEDIGYPGMGSIIGGLAGSELGPLGIAGGAAIGGMAGDATKFLSRDAQGRTAEDSPEARAASIVTSGIAGPLQEAKPIAEATQLSQGLKVAGLAGKDLTPAQRLAAEFNVPMSKAQQTQSPLRVGFERLIRSSFGTEGIFRRRLDLPANEAIIKGAQNIADRISAFKGTQSEVGSFVKDAIDSADSAAGKVYQDALAQISDAGASNLPINLKGNLQSTAQDLLKQIRLNPDFEKGLESSEGRAKAIQILETFANPTKEVETKASNLVDQFGNPVNPGGTQTVDKQLTWEEARRLRTQLFELVNSGEVNIGKGALGKLNNALNDAMRSSLPSDLASKFDTASTNYRTVQNLIEHSTIQRLIRNDKPELVADILLQKGSETNAGMLRTLIGPKMKVVERSLWEKMFSNSLQEGVAVGGRLESQFSKLGPEAQKAIWSNPDDLAKIKRFVKLVDTVSLSSNLTKPASAQGQSLLALGQFSKVTQAVQGAGAVLSMSGNGDFVGKLGSAGTIILTPMMMARVMTRPGAIDVLNDALKAKAGTVAGQKLAVQLARIAFAEQSRESLERRTRQSMDKKESFTDILQR